MGKHGKHRPLVGSATARAAHASRPPRLVGRWGGRMRRGRWAGCAATLLRAAGGARALRVLAGGALTLRSRAPRAPPAPRHPPRAHAATGGCGGPWRFSCWQPPPCPPPRKTRPAARRWSLRWMFQDRSMPKNTGCSSTDWPPPCFIRMYGRLCWACPGCRSAWRCSNGAVLNTSACWSIGPRSRTRSPWAPLPPGCNPRPAARPIPPPPWAPPCCSGGRGCCKRRLAAGNAPWTYPETGAPTPGRARVT